MSLVAYNQVCVPSFMYGTAWKKEATTKLVNLALDAGFQAIDTANQIIHYHEALVGEALNSKFANGLKRDSLFIQTKFTNVHGQDHRTPYDASAPLSSQVEQSFASSLAHLHTDYIDSYVLHGPYFRAGISEADWEIWRAMEKLYRAGSARMLGVSNVTAEQLEELCRYAEVKPMMVQNRCFAVRAWDLDVRKICREHSIIYQGFSLLTANSQVLSHPFVQDLAKRKEATAAQIIFRFSMQIGMLPLTGTSSAEHMRQDLKCQEFDLENEEIARIEEIAL